MFVDDTVLFFFPSNASQCCQNITLKHLNASSIAARHVRPGATGLWSKWAGSVHRPRIPPPTFLLPPSHALCLWLNAGILSRRLPVAKRDGAPEEAGRNVCGSLRVRRRLFILLFPPLNPPHLLLFVPLFLLSPLVFLPLSSPAES